ncbi:serine protease easter [Solenopsis invicta]|uniref:serine protease easter n=1 Tax=Solenopsis invicta TaxID=13686 RepID=UPI000E340141|nr:serine protease easter [Solenopsis invicta]
MMFIGSVVLFLAITAITAQNNCSDNNSICISIYNCPEILAVLRGPKPLSPQIIQRNTQCGFEGKYPKVCCPRQQTTGALLSRVDRSTSGDTPNPPDVTNHPNLHLLDHHSCGPLTQSKIVYGSKTAIFQYPWMALIAYERAGRPGPNFLCGGTIISSRYILTAAHCVTLLPQGVRLIGVRVGDHDISTERDCEKDTNGEEVFCAEKYQEFNVSSVHFHPEYSNSTQQNDIALIKLNNSIDFTPLSVKPICLPFGSATNLTHSKATVTGWGLTQYDVSSPDLLQAKLPMVPNEECKEIYRANNKSYVQISYKQLCTRSQMKADVCNGDSGGPLQATNTYNSKTVRYVQYGIISFGMRPCDIQAVPGVYTKVSYYMDWILNTMTN